MVLIGCKGLKSEFTVSPALIGLVGLIYETEESGGLE
jgi:hypothetical protein